MRKITAFIIAAVLFLSCVAPCGASSLEAEKSADLLYELGLFSGTGKDADGNPIYQLDRAPTRYEAVTMLVGLLGKSELARGKSWSIPFRDVALWAKPYVGYAYSMGYTSGTGAQTFGGTKMVTAQQYLTFIYRALGYSNDEVPYNEVLKRAEKDGLIDPDGSVSFTRGDVVTISYKALALKVNGTNQTLAQTLGISQSLPENHTLTADFLDTVWKTSFGNSPAYVQFSKGKYFETTPEYVDPKYADMLLDYAHCWIGDYAVFGDTAYVRVKDYIYHRMGLKEFYSLGDYEEYEYVLSVQDGILEGWADHWHRWADSCIPTDATIINHVRNFFAENGYY